MIVNNNKIAFFDSGMGGLTVLHEAFKLMPNEEYIYYADSLNAPYGTKTVADIKALVFEAVDFLAQYNLKALVLACNTATSIVIKELREKYDFPIIGMEPAIRPAVELTQGKKILVCATEKTLIGQKLATLIQNLDANEKVERLSLQELVLFAERFDLNNPAVEDYLKLQFKTIDWENFDSIVLGCTHFPFFRPQLRQMLPEHIHILDGNIGTIKELKSKIVSTTNNTPTETVFFISGRKTAASSFNRYFEFLSNF